MGSKVVNLFVSLLSIPLTYNYLGEEQFGLLMTILSVISFMAFSDLGLGLGLQSKIAFHRIHDTKREINESISSIFFFLCFFSFFILISYFIFDLSFGINRLFNLKNIEVIDDFRYGFMVFAICFCVTIPISIIQKIQNGFHRTYLNEIWESIYNIFSLILLVTFSYFKLSLPYLVFCFIGAKAIILFIYFSYFFIRKEFIISHNFFRIKVLKELLQLGAYYFLLQLSILVMTSLDSLIIAQKKGFKAVAIYNISYKMYSIFIMPIQVIVGNSLPSFTDALVNNDVKWISDFIKKFAVILLIGSLFFALLYYFSGNYIVKFWVSSDVIIPYNLLFAFSIYIIYSNINSLFLSLMMLPNLIQKCVLFFIITSIITLILKLYFINFFSFEILLYISSTVSLFVFFIPSSILIYNKFLK